MGLRGLLPYRISSQEKQKKRVIDNIRKKESDIEKYIFLSALQDRNERLYYRTIMDHVEELLPIIYTPTVGEVCKQFSHIYRIDKGFYITPEDRGDIHLLLDNWPEEDVRVIVITDGHRILGLGDLGANGIGIPIGKLSLYVAGAGIHPDYCLPVMFDVGTNNEDLLTDFMYLGYPHRRLENEEYYSLLDEFVQAVQKKYPKALIQFEDFLTPNAYKILHKYQKQVLCFNDDIQGTAAVALAGVLTSSRITGRPFKDSTIMFLGAGSAATGIADLMVQALQLEGLSKEDAYKKLWFVDIDGLLVKDRKNIMPHNEAYAQDHPQLTFLEAIKNIKPNVLIGASGAGGAFTEAIIKAMSAVNEIPVIFALSNPTANSECTAQQAYTWSEGRAIFASGSPFGPVFLNDKTYETGQGNNVYIFPGVGLGAIAVEAQYLPDTIFYKAANALAKCVSEEDLAMGKVYPRMTELREISLEVACVVAEELYNLGLAKKERPSDLKAYIQGMMYDPTY
jgi:malate dehydrogenase (oxaloacetate-decarboxylating)(NADP+)